MKKKKALRYFNNNTTNIFRIVNFKLFYHLKIMYINKIKLFNC